MLNTNWEVRYWAWRKGVRAGDMDDDCCKMIGQELTGDSKLSACTSEHQVLGFSK